MYERPEAADAVGHGIAAAPDRQRGLEHGVHVVAAAEIGVGDPLLHVSDTDDGLAGGERRKLRRQVLGSLCPSQPAHRNASHGDPAQDVRAGGCADGGRHTDEDQEAKREGCAEADEHRAPRWRGGDGTHEAARERCGGHGSLLGKTFCRARSLPIGGHEPAPSGGTRTSHSPLAGCLLSGPCWASGYRRAELRRADCRRCPPICRVVLVEAHCYTPVLRRRSSRVGVAAPTTP